MLNTLISSILINVERRSTVQGTSHTYAPQKLEGARVYTDTVMTGVMGEHIKRRGLGKGVRGRREGRVRGIGKGKGRVSLGRGGSNIIEDI